MNETTEIIDMVSMDVVEFSMADAGITLLKEKYNPVTIMKGSLDDPGTYKLTVEAIRAYREPRVAVNKERLAQGETARKHIKLVNTEGSRIIEALQENESILNDWKKDFDTAKEIAKREAAAAEEKRVDDIVERISNMKSLVPANISSDSKTLDGIINKLHDENLDTSWAMGMEDKAKVAFAETAEKLDELLVMKKQSEEMEATRAKDEADRKEREEKERLAMEEQNARIAKENAEAKAEIDAQKAELDAMKAKIKEANVKLEADKVEAQRLKDQAIADAAQAKQDIIDAENKHIADAKLAEETKAKQDKIDSKNKRNLEKRKKETEDALAVFFDEIGNESSKKIATRLLNAIKNGKVPHLTFS